VQTESRGDETMELNLDDLPTEPGWAPRPRIPRPPALPREYRPEVPPEREPRMGVAVLDARVLQRLVDIDVRLARMEKRFWVLVALTVAGQRLDLAQLLAWLK